MTKILNVFCLKYIFYTSGTVKWGDFTQFFHLLLNIYKVINYYPFKFGTNIPYGMKFMISTLKNIVSYPIFF